MVLLFGRNLMELFFSLKTLVDR